MTIGCHLFLWSPQSWTRLTGVWQCSEKLGENQDLHTRNEDFLFFFFCSSHGNYIKLKCKVGTCVFLFLKGINAHFHISGCVFWASCIWHCCFCATAHPKLVLFAIWKCSQEFWVPLAQKPCVAEAEHCWCPALALHRMPCAQSNILQIPRNRNWVPKVEMSLCALKSLLAGVSFQRQVGQGLEQPEDFFVFLKLSNQNCDSPKYTYSSKELEQVRFFTELGVLPLNWSKTPSAQSVLLFPVVWSMLTEKFTFYVDRSTYFHSLMKKAEDFLEFDREGCLWRFHWVPLEICRLFFIGAWPDNPEWWNPGMVQGRGGIPILFFHSFLPKPQNQRTPGTAKPTRAPKHCQLENHQHPPWFHKEQPPSLSHAGRDSNRYPRWHLPL